MKPLRLFLCLSAFVLSSALLSAAEFQVRAERVGAGPIVDASLLPGEEGQSINGPSLIRVPDWVSNPLGRYYLYFAHHAGKYVRLAYADRLEGPWKLHEGGVLALDAQTSVSGHIASPQAVIDEKNRRVYLFYHGGRPQRKTAGAESEAEKGQVSGVAVSGDGLAFKSLERVVGPAYLQVFSHDGRWFALNHGGTLRETARLGEPFEPLAKVIGPDIIAAVDPAKLGEPGAMPKENRPTEGPFRYTMRHVGVDVAGDKLVVYFSCVGHRPERILCTVIDLTGDPAQWRAQGAYEVLRPEQAWEGADLPLAYSRGGISTERVRELRDPAVFRDGEKAWLVYTGAGEHALGLAALRYQDNASEDAR